MVATLWQSLRTISVKNVPCKPAKGLLAVNLASFSEAIEQPSGRLTSS